MYFVLSVNTRTNSAKIVGHIAGDSLEEAIKEVKKCAKEYVLKKSEPMLHREAEDVNPDSKTVHFMRDSATNVHQIDVYSQKTNRVKGWMGTTEKSEEAKLIRRFMYSSYDIPSSAVPIAPPLPEVRVKQIPPKKQLPVGGFPSKLIEDLIESGKFKHHRETTENNSKERHLNFFDSDSSSIDTEECFQ